MEGAFASRGLAAVHVETLDEVEEIVAGRDGGGYAAALHVNAPNRIIAEARDGAAAMAAAEAAIDRIDVWRAAGVPLVVSIHDGPIATPAKAAAERALAQAIVDRSRAIHILVRATPALLAGWITINPARCIHVPHPSYDGVYAATPPRAAARAALGLDTVDPADGGREVVLGMIGTLRARKGVPRLLEALAAVPDPLPGGRRLRLLLAGRPDGPDAEEVVRRAWADQRVILRAGTVADDDLPRLLGAIDVAVVPYERYLISGWLLLALTAAIPVVAEAGAAADETVLPGALQPFRDGVGGLAAALARAPRLATREARREARRSVAGLAPDLISARFADALRSALEATEQQPA
jgi:glycosyltransferase involved in cell wall biosynthesis